MSRSAFTAAAATMLATTLATVATASAAAPPKSLTHQFPLGTQTLSHTATTSRSSSTAAPHHSATAPARPPATSQNHQATAPAAGSSHSARNWILIALVVVVLVGVFVDWLVVRRSPRRAPRPALRYEYEANEANEDSVTGTASATGRLRRTPDSFEPPARPASRTRRRRADPTGATRQEHEPPPLDIRHRQDT